MARGVIFDVDGTLVASNDAHALSWVETFSEVGHDVPFGVIRPMIGMGGDKIMPAAVGIEADSDEGQRLVERRWEIFQRSHLAGLKPTPGARALVERLKSEGFELVIATSAGGTESSAILEAAGLDDLFRKRTSSSDAEDSKPDPDIVRAAVRKSGCKPEDLVMIGDTPYDIQAATAAGVPLVAVLTGGCTVQELAGAIAFYDDPGDLMRGFDFWGELG